MIRKIWSLPNTIASYLLSRLIPKSKIESIIYDHDYELIITDFIITNVTLGKYIITTEKSMIHELEHAKISDLLGWGYLIHIWYLIFSIVFIVINNGSIAGYNLIGAVIFFLLWFAFNEYLVKHNLKENHNG